MSTQVEIKPLILAGDKETSGQQVSPAPVRLQDRIASLDVLRGAALLGILVMNIDDFGGPHVAHNIPVVSSINSAGPHGSLILALLMVKWMVFDGKMRGLFSMLFGAGVILLTDSAEKRGAANHIADIYMRRNLFLMLFGFLHLCFIWDGDILFDYGLVALLFLYPCRKMKTKTLLWTGSMMSLAMVPIWCNSLGVANDIRLQRQVKTIRAEQLAGKTITPPEAAVMERWQARVGKYRPTLSQLRAIEEKEQEEEKKSYFAGVAYRLSKFQTGFGHRRIVPMFDFLGPMLIGMALMQLGFFSAKLPHKTYVWIASIGFGISLPLYVLGGLKAYYSSFYFLDIETWLYAPYYVTRETSMLAITSTMLLVIKAEKLRSAQKLLAAVGRTAFSNYIATSIICQTVFLWGPWKLYGKLTYTQLMYVVFGVWVFNIFASSVWLSFFSFGPAEWLWRSLTYGKMQPLRLRGRAGKLLQAQAV